MLSPLPLLATLALPPEPSCSIPLLRVDLEGRATSGTKDAVLSAFKAGLPLRVDWSLDVDPDGTPEVSHWADAGFLTEFEGEVFAVPDGARRAP